MTKCFYYRCENDALEPYVWCKEHIAKYEELNGDQSDPLPKLDSEEELSSQ